MDSVDPQEVEQAKVYSLILLHPPTPPINIENFNNIYSSRHFLLYEYQENQKTNDCDLEEPYIE